MNHHQHLPLLNNIIHEDLNNRVKLVKDLLEPQLVSYCIKKRKHMAQVQMAQKLQQVFEVLL